MPKYFYPLVENPYRSKDINRAIKVLKSNKLTSGPISKSFQDFFTRKFHLMHKFHMLHDNELQNEMQKLLIHHR